MVPRIFSMVALAAMFCTVWGLPAVPEASVKKGLYNVVGGDIVPEAGESPAEQEAHKTREAHKTQEAHKTRVTLINEGSAELDSHKIKTPVTGPHHAVLQEGEYMHYRGKEDEPWSHDSVNATNPICKNAPDHETTLYLQIFLGLFGAAYGYIGLWDWFCAAFVPMSLATCLCCVTHNFIDEKRAGFIGLQVVYGVLFVYCLGLWIWGLVEICDHSLHDADGCPLK